MAKNDPKKDSGFFRTMFDLNGDGKTDAAEAALMFMMFDEMQQEEEREQQSRYSADKIIDLDDLDIEGI